MIHQLIFAHPKPGMSEAAFQRYWVDVHAVRYASRIPQIRRYLIDTRIPFGPEPEDPPFSGVAEIWLASEEEQLASLQSPEFLEGARRDEPDWAAFWRTVVLDTTTHVLLEGDPLRRDAGGVKLFHLIKRKAGMPLGRFRGYAREVHAPLALKLPGLRRYHQCHVRDPFYTIGEAILDAVFLFWFDGPGAVAKMAASPEFRALREDMDHFIEPGYFHSFLTEEHWIIGPESRRPPEAKADAPPVAGVRNLSACLAVSNLEAAARWYREVLGFEVTARRDFPELGARIAYLEANRVRLELVASRNFVPHRRPDPPAHAADQGISQLTFYVSDIDAVFANVKRRPITVAMAPVEVRALAIKAFFIRDNEGNLIEFIQHIPG